MTRTMKLRVLASLVFLVGVVSFAGCAADDPAAPDVPQPPEKTCFLIDDIVYCR